MARDSAAVARARLEGQLTSRDAKETAAAEARQAAVVLRLGALEKAVAQSNQACAQPRTAQGCAAPRAGWGAALPAPRVAVAWPQRTSVTEARPAQQPPRMVRCARAKRACVRFPAAAAAGAS